MKPLTQIITVIALTLPLTPADAHFHMLFPDPKPKEPVKPGDKVGFVYRWGHPFEHELFDAPEPGEVSVFSPSGAEEKITDFKKLKDKPIAYRFEYQLPKGSQGLGNYVFAMKAPQVLLDGEIVCKDSIKVVVHVGDSNEGWDQTVGLPFELVPLTRPYGLEPGMVFQAQALYEKKPLAGALVEVERYNDAEPKEKPPNEQRTRVVKTDPNGVLTCTLTDPGWWCITAQQDAGKVKHDDGKQYPLQLRTTFWVYVDPKH